MERWPAALSSQLRHNGAPVEVLLDASRLAWKGAERSGRARGDPSGDGSHAVQVCEIVAVREAESAQTNTGTERRRSIKNVTKHSKLFPHAFTVSYVRRAGYHRWQCSDITFSCTSQRLCQQWIQSINDQLALLSNRPRSLLVYINPYGGKQLGKWIYEQKVAPLFHHASISADVIVTERANHATDHLKTEANLEKYDGVVCVGGDGMFSEILHGLVSRTQADSGVDQNQPDAKLVPCSLRIGIIPAGSTDCICYATVGANDPVTSALHIIVGDSQPMDVSSVHSRDAFLRYSVSLLGYGFYGDVLADSEKKRWMGPARYDLAGVKTFLGHNYYEGTVSFVPAEDHQGDPRDKRRCRAGCHACQHRPHADDKLWKTPEEKEKSEKDGGGGGVWCAIQGKFVAINAANISCACPRSPEGLSPSAHLADGTTDLILVRRCSRLDFLRHLLRHTNKQDQFDHAFVEVHRVRRFRFQPKHQEALSIEDLNEATRKKALRQLCGPAPVCHGAAAHSSWTCDGEILPHAAIQVSVQSQLIRLFARGIEEQQCVSEDPHTPESPEAMTQHLS